tara:strand:- start:13453 stop:14160 length:708 start_codon:yes stop_codon:yes gene_type:complete
MKPYKNSYVGMAAAALVWGIFSLQPTNAALISTDLSTQVSVPGISQFTTDGADMVGMSVTVNFFGGGSETVAWAATGPQSGAATGAFGTGWSISSSGDTFNTNAWAADFGNLQVTSFVMDGTTGLTLFDRDFDPLPGTPGSADGRDFATTLVSDALVQATYSNVVSIGATPPVGDIFHILTVDFAEVENGTVSGLFNFTQDTDNDIRIQVPEPAMLPVFGLGLAGLAIAARRRPA